MDDFTANSLESEALSVASEAAEILQRQSESISDYLNAGSENGRVVLQKRDTGGSLDPLDRTDGATTTAFAISRLVRSLSVEPHENPPSPPPGISLANLKALAETTKLDFGTMYGLANSAPGVAKVAGDLPNYYSTPLHISGLIAALKLTDGSDDTSLHNALNEVVLTLAVWLEDSPFISGDSLKSAPGTSNKGELSTLADGSPNWYLTYLVADALASYIEMASDTTATYRRVISALDRTRAASLLALSRMIALSSAGLSGIFDALDLGGCLATIGRCVSATGHSDLITSRLLGRGLELLGADFLTPYGAFAPKGPAMVDRTGALLEISSSELAEAVLSSLSQFLQAERIAVLLPAIKLTCQRAEGHRGWGSSSKGGVDRRDLFAASSSLALLNEFTMRIDRMRHTRASSALDVEPAPDMDTISYPEHLAKTIEKKVIHPIQAGRRDLAAMSLLLYGPPGTAKTTIARKIASDLRWPILELTPSRLLLTGFEEITSRAEDLFSLLADLRDVVVLFDEFEGFIGRRDNDGASDASKFLTTFMLPKLHRLRDSGQVVFVVATNDQTAIDSAASRPGRIDTVLSVNPPSVEEVRDVIRAFSRRTRPLRPFHQQWDELWVSISNDSDDQEIAGLTYGYISRWVKDVALEFHTEYTNIIALERLSELRERLSRESNANAQRQES